LHALSPESPGECSPESESTMKTQDINSKIDRVAEKAKELNTKASEKLQEVAAKAEILVQETAEKGAQSAQELATKAEQLAREASPKPSEERHSK
jgi:DNA-binding ferritin-like protein